jgi:site-specific DNA recombinase
MRCALYARVSTQKQADKELSIPAQLRLMREHARQQGWIVVDEFIEPGTSATSLDRPVLQRLLTQIRDGSVRVDVILAHKLNRLARNLDDYVPIRAALLKEGVRLTYVVERVDDSASGRLVENVIASIAQFESANLSEETKKGMRQRVLQGGWPHKPPRGYITVRRSDDQERASHIEIHPREGPLVIECFELFATGRLSIDVIASKMATKGLTSLSGTPFSHSYLHRILTNQFYTGRIKWNDLEVDGKHPPLIRRDLYDRVQTVFRDRATTPLRNRTSRGFPLKGLAKCVRCRGHLTAERHGRFGYYRCSRKANRSSACDARYCRADRVHADLVSMLRRLQLTRRAADEIRAHVSLILEGRMRDRDQQQRAIETQLGEIAAGENRLTELFIAGQIASQSYRAKVDELRVAQSVLEARRRGLLTDADTIQKRAGRILDLSTSLLDIYESLSEVRRPELLRILFQNVVLGADGIVGAVQRPLFEALSDPVSTIETAARVVASAEESHFDALPLN